MKKKGPIALAPFIYNRNNFIFREHPVFHPKTNQYRVYWESEERKAVEGYWGLDQQSDQYDPSKEGGYRYICPQHYWYTNYCFIQHESDDNPLPQTIKPDLRDIDWYWYYNFFTAWGFSGFSDDEDFSSNRLLELYLKDPKKFLSESSPKFIKAFEKHEESMRKPNGDWKEYVEAREYLQKTHSQPLGLPLYQNTLLNLVDMEARGGGKSYRAMGLISHEYNFFGARTWEGYVNTDKGPTICVGSINSNKSGELLAKFRFSQDKLVDNFGAYYDEAANGGKGKFTPGFFHKEYMGSLKEGNEKNSYRHEYKRKVSGVWKKEGTRTNIVHNSYNNNPSAFVGQRSILMIEDEFGLNDLALESSKADETVMIMNNKMGIALKTGTGGEVKKSQQAKEIFYNPVTKGYLGFPDHWENYPDPIGMFVPAYYQDSTFRDAQGNQDIQKAYEQEMFNRKRVEDDPTALDALMVYRPLVPSEMFLAPELNIFPTAMLREHKINLENKKVFESIASVGELDYNNPEMTRVKFRSTEWKRQKPIRDFDLKAYEGKTEGRVVIYEFPDDYTPDPTSKRSLYKIVYDPYRDDGVGGPSLAAIKVYKGISEGNWNHGMYDTLVAEFYGRRNFVSDIHEIAIKLALYYNAKILVETNVPGFITHCRNNKRLNLLQIKPVDAISKAVKNISRKYEVGVEMNKTIKIHAEQLLNEWLWRPRSDGKKNLHSLMSTRLIDELIHYDRKKNTDGVSAMFLLMLWISQEEIIPIKKRGAETEKNRINEYFKETMASRREELVSYKNPFHAF